MLILNEDGLDKNTEGHEWCGGAVRVEEIDGRLPEDAVFAGELRNAINEALGRLEPVEATVLKMLYGVGMLVDHTPLEIAAYLGLTERRVMAIERRALQRLQSAFFTLRLRGMASESI